MTTLGPLNLNAWIDEHRDLLKPPVGNKCVWEDQEFIVMVVGGPNGRADYHINRGQELFFQIEGDITLKVLEDGVPKDISIREGELFLLPGGIPHSPQRPAKTVGLVVERQRHEGELDALRWHCEGCHNLLHEETFQLRDIASQIKHAIEAYYSDEQKRTCSGCGAVMAVPEPTAG